MKKTLKNFMIALFLIPCLMLAACGDPDEGDSGDDGLTSLTMTQYSEGLRATGTMMAGTNGEASTASLASLVASDWEDATDNNIMNSVACLVLFSSNILESEKVEYAEKAVSFKILEAPFAIGSKEVGDDFIGWLELGYENDYIVGSVGMCDVLPNFDDESFLMIFKIKYDFENSILEEFEVSFTGYGFYVYRYDATQGAVEVVVPLTETYNAYLNEMSAKVTAMREYEYDSFDVDMLEEYQAAYTEVFGAPQEN